MILMCQIYWVYPQILHLISFQALKLDGASFSPMSQVRASAKFLFMTAENYKVHFWGIHQGHNLQTKFCKVVLLFQKWKLTQGNIS